MRIALAAALPACTLTTAGCGKSGSDGETAGNTAAAPESAAAAAAAADASEVTSIPGYTPDTATAAGNAATTPP